MTVFVIDKDNKTETFESVLKVHADNTSLMIWFIGKWKPLKIENFKGFYYRR